MRNIFLFFFVCLFMTSIAQKNPCADPHVHDFDFWLGKWDVYNIANNKRIADSYIQSINDSCAIQEHYSNPQAKYQGTSLNKYNFEKNQWEQYWVDNSGLTLKLSGNLQGKNMVLQGETTQTNKTVLSGTEMQTVLNRITWYNNPNGTVRQHWETSSDKGVTWQTAFDGLYKRKE